MTGRPGGCSRPVRWGNPRDAEYSTGRRCAPAGERALCPLNVNTLGTWYRPRPVPRTFLLVGLPFMPQKIADPPPASLGSPLEVGHVGGFTIYIYAGDAATRLQ